MFRGENTKVRIRFENSLAGVVLDRFGMDTIIIPESDSGHFTVTADVAISKQFYSWLFGFPGQCEVLSPEWVRDEIRKISEDTLKQYK